MIGANHKSEPAGRQAQFATSCSNYFLKTFLDIASGMIIHLVIAVDVINIVWDRYKYTC